MAAKRKVRPLPGTECQWDGSCREFGSENRALPWRDGAWCRLCPTHAEAFDELTTRTDWVGRVLIAVPFIALGFLLIRAGLADDWVAGMAALVAILLGAAGWSRLEDRA